MVKLHIDPPRDPHCGRLAADMPELDDFWVEDEEQYEAMTEDDKRDERVAYARQDGTYNKKTGHFTCDECYIAIGMPSSPSGWVTP